MSYRITYDHPEIKKDRTHSSIFRFPLMLLLSITTFLIFTCTFWAEGKEILLELLFPKSGQITGQAIETFAEQLQNGVPVSDAVTDFCLEIIQNASFIH